MPQTPYMISLESPQIDGFNTGAGFIESLAAAVEYFENALSEHPAESEIIVRLHENDRPILLLVRHAPTCTSDHFANP